MLERKTPEEILSEIQEQDVKKDRGELKIFFGFAAGVGKTYSMLEAAHNALDKGVDVVCGYIEPHARPQTSALLKGLEVLPTKKIQYNNIILNEFDLDLALKRKPQLILVDELAHTNGAGCRHNKRYRDIEELLAHGIDVYTTVNVQHIESLNDIVSSITGVLVRERIPDSVFDNADYVELIDIEPQDLIERLNAGEVYKQAQAQRAVQNFFTLENLTALREIALRRCADRVNMLTENNRIKKSGEVGAEEHILVCLSSAPSNPTIIRTAARMAYAFRAKFTALFVQTQDFKNMSEENKKRLQANMNLAKQLGARIETVFGDDVPLQIAEFSRLFGVSKIVLGRSAVGSHSFIRKPSLTDRLIEAVPNMDVHIIPDMSIQKKLYRKKPDVKNIKKIFSLSDTLKSLGILILASAIGFLFLKFGFTEANIISVYILSVLLISVITSHRLYSLIASGVSVILFNFFFTEPRFSLEAYDSGYPVTFLIMFISAFLSSSLAIRLKANAKQSANSAYRMKILFDSNQLFQKTTEKKEISEAVAKQVNKLLQKDVIIYLNEDGKLSEPQIFAVSDMKKNDEYLSSNERAVASWVFKNNKHAGATTDTLSNSKCLYLAIRINETVYGVIGIVMGKEPLDSFEYSILLSILGEGALAFENEKNMREKKDAAVRAKNEQLVGTFLRSISDDLKMPLSSVCTNSKTLLTKDKGLEENERRKLYKDIYNDSLWLSDLVENLKRVSKSKEGQIKPKLKKECINDIIYEALRHIKIDGERTVKTEKGERLFVIADSRLILQVIANIIDNALRYTPKGSEILITAKEKESFIQVSISDNGIGIPENVKPHIFEIFNSDIQTSENNKHRMGIGLSLCKSIINAHGGTFSLCDNKPHGAIFTFSIPKAEENEA